jgi:hypothetical protein
MAGDVLLDAFVFHLVDRADFMRASAIMAAVPLAGTVLSAELSEGLRAFGAQLPVLFWLSLATVGTSVVLTVWLPHVGAHYSAGWAACHGMPHSATAAAAEGAATEGEEASAVGMAPALAGMQALPIGTSPLAATEPAVARIQAQAKPPRPPSPHTPPSATRLSFDLERTAILSRAVHLPPPRPFAWLASYARQLRSHPRLGMLTLWWVTMQSPTFIFLQSYATNLFEDIDPKSEWNGHVTAASSVLMAGAALAAPRLFAAIKRHPSLFHVMACSVVATGVACLGLSRTVLQAYMLYSGVMALLQLQLCIVQADVAHELESGQYGGLFAVNALLSLILQSAAQVCRSWPEVCDAVPVNLRYCDHRVKGVCSCSASDAFGRSGGPTHHVLANREYEASLLGNESAASAAA